MYNKPVYIRKSCIALQKLQDTKPQNSCFAETKISAKDDNEKHVPDSGETQR